jgi:DNA-binding NarL/FixJ family response regulator
MLFVDDNRRFRQIFCEALSNRFGFSNVEEAGSLAEGLKKFRGSAPGLVILDIGFPDGSGIELAESILQESPQTIIAFCTLYDSPGYRLAAQRLGISHYFLKYDMNWNEICELLAEETRMNAQRREVAAHRGSGIEARESEIGHPQEELS